MVVFFIVTPYLVGVPLILWPMFSHDLISFTLHFIFSTFLIGGCLHVYFKSCFTDPGKVPEGWTPQGGNRYTLLEYDEDLESSKKKKYCEKCNNWKPPRTHHCKSCGRCVLRMDHHCPWINNCVGYHNHKYFLLFLIYICLSILYLLLMIVLRAIMLWGEYHLTRKPIQPKDGITICVLGVFNFSLVIAVGALLFWQLSLITSNKTNIEYYEYRRREYRARKENKKKLGEMDIYFPYDLGSTSENTKEILGPNVWLWFLPVPTQGSGLDYRVSRHYLADLQNRELLEKVKVQEI